MDLGWNRSRLYPSEMMEVMEDREVWWLNLELLPRNPHGTAGNEERRRKKKKEEERRRKKKKEEERRRKKKKEEEIRKNAIIR